MREIYTRPSAFGRGPGARKPFVKLGPGAARQNNTNTDATGTAKST